MNRSMPLLCAAALLLGGCLENEEQITIAEDGSVQIRVSAEGDRTDLADGSPIPKFGPWQPVDEHTAAWLGAADQPPEASQGGDKLKVTVEASFDCVEDLPRFYAPEKNPYRTASLQRSASLEVKVRGERKIYVFERRYHSPGQGLLDPMQGLDDQMPREMKKEFQKKAEPSAKSWRWVHRTLLAEYQRLADSYLRKACIVLFLEEESSLTSRDMDEILANSEENLVGILSEEHLRGIYHQLLAEQELPKEQRPKENPFQALEQEIRGAIRGALTTGLQQAGIDMQLQNRALATFEWWLAASDHSDDLGDESFKVTVTMPGKIIAGNFDALTSTGAASWNIGGGILGDRDVVMRVISIVE